jgi:hypothetical protein
MPTKQKLKKTIDDLQEQFSGFQKTVAAALQLKQTQMSKDHHEIGLLAADVRLLLAAHQELLKAHIDLACSQQDLYNTTARLSKLWAAFPNLIGAVRDSEMPGGAFSRG